MSENAARLDRAIREMAKGSERDKALPPGLRGLAERTRLADVVASVERQALRRKIVVSVRRADLAMLRRAACLLERNVER
jgi:hypothetical protein